MHIVLLRIRFFFFFSSRRRHTRCSRDWSSDVCSSDLPGSSARPPWPPCRGRRRWRGRRRQSRSEEHTSELQSRLHLVCRLLLEKKKTPQPSSKMTCKSSVRAPSTVTSSARTAHEIRHS